MAIDMDLNLATQLPAADVAGRLAEIGRDTGVFGAEFTGERLMNKQVFLYTPQGMWVRVLEEEPPHPWDPIVTDLGLTRTAAVAFRMGKETETWIQQDDMIRLVAPLLARVDGDAVLHFQYEVIWLFRKNGELNLNERDDIWRPERLSLLQQPYRRQTHMFDSF
ncbi:SitI3 family protein [Streptomyces sp. L2]|uniref:SitI3 family protein n=1 Tax=Streptomyces sp. L2 TaxID=2162665 RepID=UPI001013BBED|nr:SitI3 family protein [Streptomyces sp. L2]